LPNIVVFISRSAGSILYHEGALPENCYVLLNGEVGVFMKAEEDCEENEMMVSTQTPSGTEVEVLRPKHRVHSHSESANGGLLFRRTSALGLHGIQYDTGEGGSNNMNIELGDQVNTLKAVTVFGESALMSDQPRGASIKCTTDCQLLVIKKEDFNRVLKQEMTRVGNKKLEFLTEHVPGMRDLHLMRDISSKISLRLDYLFRRATYKKGHLLFSQGEVAQSALYVVFEGCLEMRRVDTLGSLPGDAAVRSKRPSSSIRPRNCRQNRLSRARSLGGRRDAADVATTGAGRILGVLMAGAVFGSIPVQAPEPYSVVVASQTCELFQAVGPSVEKLPIRLLEVIRDYLATSTAWRLKTYINEAHCVTKSRQSRDESSPS
jgi:CRP-like cAMP-binding protein